MTRDICMSTLSLLILTLLTVVIFTVLKPDGPEYWQIFSVPVLYLSVMFFVTKAAAKNRARRFVELVIKEDLIKTRKQHCRLNPERKQKQYKERGRKDEFIRQLLVLPESTVLLYRNMQRSTSANRGAKCLRHKKERFFQ